MAGACSGGGGLLPLAGDVTLGDVPLGDVTSGDVPLGDVPLGDVPLGDVSPGERAAIGGVIPFTGGGALTLAGLVVGSTVDCVLLRRCTNTSFIFSSPAITTLDLSSRTYN